MANDFSITGIAKAIGSFFKGSTVKSIIDLIPTKEKKREFELKLRQSMYQFLQSELKDRESARAMQIEALKQDDKFSKRFIYYLTAILLSSTVIVSLLPFFVEYPKENLSIITRGTDFLYTISGAQIINFFFGTRIKKSDN